MFEIGREVRIVEIQELGGAFCGLSNRGHGTGMGAGRPFVSLCAPMGILTDGLHGEQSRRGGRVRGDRQRMDYWYLSPAFRNPIGKDKDVYTGVGPILEGL